MEEEPLGLDPHEYFGVALNAPTETIPKALAQEIARLGRMELWEFQAFFNHDHPFLQTQSEEVEAEAAMIDAWAARLSERLPHLRLVVQTDPLESMTWYQATDTAPTTDDETFVAFSTPTTYRYSAELWNSIPTDLDPEEQRLEMNRRARVGPPPRTGSVGPCEKCGEEEPFTDPFPLPTHRGVRLIECRACGAQLVHSTRTIRTVVEPTETSE